MRTGQLWQLRAGFRPLLLVVTALHAPVAFGQDLLSALELGGAQEVRARLAAGADPNQRGLGVTPLIEAVRAPNLDAVDALLSAGADANLLDAGGRSALMYAAAAYDDPRATAIAERLLEAGADTNLRTPDGTTPLLELLGQAPSTSALRLARTLIAAGADTNVVGTGETPLSLALARGWLEAVDLLLASGADVNLILGDGRTALLRAAAEGAELKVLRRLLRAPVDLNARDPEGRTALMLVARDDSPTTPIRLFTLLAAGADPTLHDEAGRRALFYARQNLRLEGTPALRALRAATGG